MSAVSILVPTYNRRDMLRECLDSLLSTTVPCEIIVSDNASTDGTETLMAAYDDPRLRYHRHPENVGAYRNYNFLLGQATKEYICLFGDDDIALPGCFELKLAVLENCPDVAGVYSPSRVLDGDGNLIMPQRVNGTPEVSLLRGRDEFRTMLVNCAISWQTLVFRRELYDSHGGVKSDSPIRWAGDWDYLIEISKDRQFACLQEPTVGVRIHAGSGGNKVSKESGALAEDMLHIWQKWLIDSDDYPEIPVLTWEDMRRMLIAAVQICHGQDQGQMQRHLDSFEALHQAYRHKMNTHVYRSLQGWVPAWVELDGDGLPVFRRGVAPLPVDTSRRALFLHVPDGSRDAWRAVVRTYLTTFDRSDDMELILWLDPAGGLDTEQIVSWIETVTAEAGLAEDRVADMLLLVDPLSLEQLAGLFATVHAVIPAGDPVLTRRAAQVGTIVMTHHDGDVWRRISDQMLGIKRT
jgi:hypothetical protein